jgi:hypothetical protein
VTDTGDSMDELTKNTNARIAIGRVLFCIFMRVPQVIVTNLKNVIIFKQLLIDTEIS